MALQCPQCSNSIEADFGVVTCSQCQSVLFVDMEGNVQLSDNSDSNLGPPAGLFNGEASSPASPAESSPGSWSTDQNPVSFEPAPVEGFDSYQPTNFEADSSEISLELESHGQDLQLAPTFEEAASNSQIVYSQSPMEPPSIDENDNSIMNEENQGDLSDVSQFSNSDEPVGPLSYSILIEAIDTQDIRMQISEALSDPKFQWDSKEILKKIKMGKLVLENLNPIKASILVHRLQTLPVKVSWTQNVYS